MVSYLSSSRSLLIMVTILSVCGVGGKMSKYELIRHLLNISKYDTELKPDTERVTDVDVQVEIYEITRSEAKYSEFTLSMFLRMWWSDHRLDFSNLANYSKLAFAERNVQKLWQPDVFFLSSQKLEKSSSNRMLYVYRNGSIVYSERMSMIVRSSFDLTYYPYDEEVCQLEIQSFTYTNDSLALHWHKTHPVKLSGAGIAEFQISIKQVTRDEAPSLDQVGRYSTLKSVVVLRRTGHAHFYQLYGPSFAVVFVSWLALFLDERRISPRLAIHTGCIIALTTQWVGVYFLTPTVSYIRAVEVWMITHLLIVVTTFLANILSLMARRDDSPNEHDKVEDITGKREGCEDLLFSRLAKFSHSFKKTCCCCACSCFLRFLCSCESELDWTEKDTRSANRQGKLIEYVAIISLFLFYVTFIITYAILIPAHKISIVTFFFVTAGCLFGSVTFVSLVFCSIGNIKHSISNENGQIKADEESALEKVKQKETEVKVSRCDEDSTSTKGKGSQGDEDITSMKRIGSQGEEEGTSTKGRGGQADEDITSTEGKGSQGDKDSTFMKGSQGDEDITSTEGKGSQGDSDSTTKKDKQRKRVEDSTFTEGKQSKSGKGSKNSISMKGKQSLSNENCTFKEAEGCQDFEDSISMKVQISQEFEDENDNASKKEIQSSNAKEGTPL